MAGRASRRSAGAGGGFGGRGRPERARRRRARPADGRPAVRTGNHTACPPEQGKFSHAGCHHSPYDRLGPCVRRAFVSSLVAPVSPCCFVPAGSGLAAHRDRGTRPAAPLSPAGLSIDEHGTPRSALDFPNRGCGTEPKRARTAGITEEQGTVMVRSGSLVPLREARPGDDTRRAPGAQERASPRSTRRAATCRRPPFRGRRGRRAPPPALPASDRRGGTARRRPEGPASSGVPGEACDDRFEDRHPTTATLTHDPAPQSRRGPRRRSTG